jgi:fructokinase
VRVVDTIGTGDTFMGTLLAELLARGGEPALSRLTPPALGKVLSRCVANAAITVSRAGADPPSVVETTTSQTLGDWHRRVGLWARSATTL